MPEQFALMPYPKILLIFSRENRFFSNGNAENEKFFDAECNSLKSHRLKITQRGVPRMNETLP